MGLGFVGVVGVRGMVSCVLDFYCCFCGWVIYLAW